VGTLFSPTMLSLFHQTKPTSPQCWQKVEGKKKRRKKKGGHGKGEG